MPHTCVHYMACGLVNTKIHIQWGKGAETRENHSQHSCASILNAARALSTSHWIKYDSVRKHVALISLRPRLRSAEPHPGKIVSANTYYTNIDIGNKCANELPRICLASVPTGSMCSLHVHIVYAGDALASRHTIY